jgi:hypothetical protein
MAENVHSTGLRREFWRSLINVAINGIGNTFADVPQLGLPGGTAVNGNGGQTSNSFLIDDELTPQDKALVGNATGSVDLPNGQINLLGMEIALDRYTGNLQGTVTASYIEGISAAETRDQTDAIPQSVLSNALNYIADQATNQVPVNSTALYG